MDPINFPLTVALCNGIVAIFTKVAPELRKFAPLVALQVGVVAYPALNGFSASNVIYGAVAACVSVGVWSSGRSLAAGVVDLTAKN